MDRNYVLDMLAPEDFKASLTFEVDDHFDRRVEKRDSICNKPYTSAGLSVLPCERVTETGGPVRPHGLLAITLCALVGCGAPRAPTSPSVSASAPVQISPPSRDLPPPDGVAAPSPGAYTLRIEMDDTCPLPSAVKVRTYNVVLKETRGTFLSVVASDASSVLVGDIWFASWGGVIFRWNGSEDLADCGVSETIGSSPFCVWGEAPGGGRVMAPLLATLTAAPISPSSVATSSPTGS